MNFKIVERRTAKGKPTWYFYGPTGYIGAMFLPDGDHAAALHAIIQHGTDQDYKVEHVMGPDFGQSAADS